MTMTFVAPSVPCDDISSVDQLHEWRMEAQARRAGTIDNQGRFALLNPYNNVISRGERFNLSAEDIIELTRADTASEGALSKHRTTGTKHSWSDKEAA